MMSIKKICNYNNLTEINSLYEKARILLSFHHSGQWQDDEPSPATIQRDITHGNFYGLYDGEKLLGTCALLDEDPSYKVLVKGAWLNNDPYKVIHRFVIDQSFHRLGYGSTFLNFIEKMCLEDHIDNIRVDTHILNKPMTHLLLKNHYIECGEALIEGVGLRIVYHKQMRNIHGTTTST